MQYSAEAAGNAGQLHCHVIRRPFSNDGRAHFSINVGNETNDEAKVFAFAAGAPDSSRLAVVRTTIGARCEFSTSAAFELPRTGSTPELHVILSSGDIEFTLVVPGQHAGRAALPAGNGLHAALPAPVEAYAGDAAASRSAVPTLLIAPSPRRAGEAVIRARKSPAVAPILALFGTVMVAVTAILLRPQIREFVVPATAAAGATVSVRYSATGLGTAAYSVLGPSGVPIEQGRLALGTGSFALTLPPARIAAPAYLIRVRVSSALGAAVAEDYLHVSAAPPASVAVQPRLPRHFPRLPTRLARSLEPPLIRSLALDRATLASGETLGVYYDVLAADGAIVLTDPAAQVTYGKAAFSTSGRATFVAPYVDAPRLLSVIVTARRGPATTQSRIVVTVTPPQDADANAAGDGANAARSSVPSVAAAISAPATVHSRQPIRVDIAGATAGLSVALLDEAGAEIASRDAPLGRSNVQFTAPTVHVPTRLVLTATYQHGQGSEMIVRSVTVIP